MVWKGLVLASGAFFGNHIFASRRELNGLGQLLCIAVRCLMFIICLLYVYYMFKSEGEMSFMAKEINEKKKKKIRHMYSRAVTVRKYY